MSLHYSFSSELWLYPGYDAWHFITLPQKYAAEIKEIGSLHKRGFGSLRVEAEITGVRWKTSIFPDSRSKSYVIPIKKEVRQKTKIQAGDKVKIQISIVES